jgi:hypothetical protein
MDSITQGTQKTNTNPVFLAIMGIGALLIAGLLGWLLLSPAPPKQEAPQLQGALREGAEYEEIKKKIVVDPLSDLNTEARSLAGGLQMNMWAVIRNFSGKTLTGLEVVGSVVDKDGNVVREKAAIVIPTNQPKLDPNRTMPISVNIDGFEESDDRSNIKWRITAIKID